MSRREFQLEPRGAAQLETRGVDAPVATLATMQWGVVSHAQLVALGLTRHEIGDRLGGGRLHAVHRGVYSVGHRHLGREGRYLAAVLAAGSGAVLSHRSAAALWQLRAASEVPVHVTAPVHREGGRGLRIHQSRLDPREITTCQGIPVTTPLRSLIDLASCLTRHQLEPAIRQAVFRRLTTTELLAEAVERHAGRRGIKSLRASLISLGEAPGRTRSGLEDRFLPFLRKHRLPMPELNFALALGNDVIEPDCVWKEQRVIVELDGRDAHDSTPAFESDRARDSALQAAGWKVVRVTSARLLRDRRRLASELRTMLAPANFS